MRPQAPAVLAVDDGAAGCTGVALVGDDQFQRVAEQFDMLVIDRGDAGGARADQTNRIVAAADAGLEHREVASALLKIQAGQREHGLEAPNLLARRARHLGDGGRDPRHQPRQLVIADRRAIDLKALVETIEMRRGEQAGAQAEGAADAGAERRGRALAVRPGHHHRDALQPGAIHRERVEQRGQPRQANAVAVFRQVKQCNSPIAENV